MVMLYLFKCAVFLSCSWQVLACHTFRNTPVRLKQENGEWFSGYVSGCLERQSFEDHVIAEVLIQDEGIRVFDIDAIRHLVHLENITVANSQLRTIKPNAFRNLPRLKYVKISGCRVSEIQRQIFNTFPSLERIELQINNIDVIEGGAFSDIHSLRFVNLSYNAIRYYNKNWFDDSESVEVLDLRHNSIRSVGYRGFSNMPMLKYLNLDHNDITTIGYDLFKGVRAMHYLGFGSNLIEGIDAEAFLNPINIEELRLEANHLYYIPPTVLANITVDKVALYGNPFNCGCMEMLREWVAECTWGQWEVPEECDREDLPVCIAHPDPTEGCLTFPHQRLQLNFYTVLRNLEPRLDESCYRFE